MLMARTIAALRCGMREGGLTASMPAATKAQLAQRLNSLRACNTPSPAIEIKKQIAKLFLGYTSMRGVPPAEAEAMLFQYAEVLEGVPLWALQEICKSPPSGPDLDPRFPPNAVQIRLLVDARAATFRREAKDIQELLDAPVVLPDDPEVAAELKKTVGEGLRNLAKQLRDDDEALRRPVLVPEGSGFKAPSGRDLAEIYRTRQLPGLPVRNGPRNDDRNGDVTVDTEYADHLRDAVGQ
ncbi:hypothetical protein [Tardiphaga sp. 862_B3_N1_1]|uniref:hypothetical protein n=1 Tax=Tardiphaga sp. 862_B3_N1_1 TaxID=3240763 RepID=UPI003F8B9276